METTYESSRDKIRAMLRRCFDGFIVRKDLTKQLKEGANVPVYVLEYLLGSFCNSDDEHVIAEGVEKVKEIISKNFVRTDENQKILSRLRQQGVLTIIDRVTVNLNIGRNGYYASFSNLGIGDIKVDDDYVCKYERLLCGGIWCRVMLEYQNDANDNDLMQNAADGEQGSKKGRSATKGESRIRLLDLEPIQLPYVDMDALRTGRRMFSKEEWIDVMLRSMGMEPDVLSTREKWLLLLRMVPLVEKNYNLCELGPRSTGKSHLYKEISPNSILVSGGQTTVANLFFNMSNKTMGLVGLWDCVAFDEVAGIRFKDKDGVQIMKDYMASGSFARGKDEKVGEAFMVFVGNVDQSVETLLRTSTLFDPFPPEMGKDTAFLDRMHCYLPGWEVPKFHPKHFTDDYGFISDYLSEFVRELRKVQMGNELDKYFILGKTLNQRDTISVRRTVDGLLKLVYPDGVFSKEDLEEVLRIALEMRRRVKEQLKKLGGMEFYDVNFSYIDRSSFEEKYVSVPEQGGGKLIPEGVPAPGQVYTVSQCKTGMFGVYRLESQMLPGSGKFDRSGIGTDRESKESAQIAYHFLKANAQCISSAIKVAESDFVVNYSDLQGIGMSPQLAMPTLIALCSIALGRPTVSSLVMLGEFSIGGSIIKTERLADALQVCADSGAKKVLLPIASASDLATVPGDLIGKFNINFYNSPEDAVFKALGVE